MSVAESSTSSLSIAIVDYGMGNLLSVRNALEAIGAKATIVDRGDVLRDFGAIVLPGVGAFGKGMAGLKERGFVDALDREVREKKKPFLGICLGLQLLAEHGTELGTHSGLGWLRGTVTRFAIAPDLRVPHIGWNEVHGRSRLLEGLPQGASFYFVHSFHFVPDEVGTVAAETDYGGQFVSMIEVENIFGAQFHPEKSHKHGLALLKNFVSIAART
jgi:imidazole glycerol-phosphate synthase subunit HisH